MIFLIFPYSLPPIHSSYRSVFADFGPSFTVTDQTGEEPLTGMVASISSDGTVACLDETRHGLEDGDHVTFTEVQGIPGLNGCEAKKVAVTGPYTFKIDAGELAKIAGDGGEYKSGGMFLQVKQPRVFKFVSL